MILPINKKLACFVLNILYETHDVYRKRPDRIHSPRTR